MQRRLDTHWQAVCAAVVLAAFGVSGALAGALYVVIRPKGGRHASAAVVDHCR